MAHPQKRGLSGRLACQPKPEMQAQTRPTKTFGLSTGTPEMEA
ncbi:hypothetical protein [Spirosoma luteum]|nr:hypothetical protein [Spirosoma luteum]